MRPVRLPEPVTRASSTVRVAIDGAVGVLTLSDPERQNGFTPELLEDLPAALAQLTNDPAVRAIILTGEGTIFCSGGYIPAMATMMEGAREARAPRARTIMAASQRLAWELAQVPWPVIAALNGPVIGAGLGLALGCDFRIASERSRLMFGFARIGASPDCGVSYWLPRLIGEARANALLLDEPILRPRRAAELGLVDQVVPAEELMGAAREKAERLAQRPAQSTRHTRALVRASPENLRAQLDRESERFVDIVASPDFEEGITAFLAGRMPNFGGSA